ncbi:hypothetical protein FLW53_01730 [Microbispora sp. SCL1-1]|jgi:hypothetical protein|uniref:Peptidase inhibitor family I36 protein n=1 Tax=Microbispora hainanensis TaxID=568844 RepID=A0A544Z1I3_9ACTN|nr:MULTISPECIES: hypothetical protein [Microbispora]NJP22946.1 hypothetical protein [Microbispora sp. CL1-1]TQS16965.1 hypothetical protein FLW53_01730 [Microbispora sp. SCL1-1]TQS22855.1 hypothetical protein FLX08_05770 [Microbispora hainanensis]
MRAKRFPSLLGLAFLAAFGLAAAQPAHEASAATTCWGDDWCGHGGHGGAFQGQWQYQSMASSSLGTGPDAYPTAIIDID